MNSDAVTKVTALLNDLSSPDAVTRTTAENVYKNAISSQKDEILVALTLSLSTLNIPVHLRKLAAILIRRAIIDGGDAANNTADDEPVNYFKLLSSDSQDKIKSGLLLALGLSDNEMFSSNICEIVGELTNYSLELNEWPDVLQYMYDCLQSTEERLRCTGYSLLEMISDTYIDGFLENPSTLATLVNILSAGLTISQSSANIFHSALKCLASVLGSISRESQISHFHSILPTLLTSFNYLVDLQDSLNADSIVNVVEILISIADERTYFFDHVDVVFQNIMSVIERPHLYSPLKRMLVEFLTTLCIKSSKKCRKLRGPNHEKYYFSQRLFPVCINMMILIPDDPKWEFEETVEAASSIDIDSDDALNSELGETSLDRMTQALGLRSTYSVVSTHLISLFQHSDWKYQHSALRYLGNYMEVTSKIPKREDRSQHQQEVITTLTRYLLVPHPRVRYAGFFALSQFLVFHGKELTNVQLDSILCVILANSTAQANRSPRVRRNAVGSLINFIDVSSVSYVEPHIGDILTVIIQALTEGPKIVQEFCVLVITSLAETLKGDIMANYYDALMPMLKAMLSCAIQSGEESLWGQTLECCAMLGEASGKAKFLNDATDMMNSLVSIQSQLGEGSDLKKYLLKAWVRIARCLGAEFLPFLQLVMESLMNTITQDVTSGILPENIEDYDEEGGDIQVVETESGLVAVRNSAVEEQSSACQLVILIAEKLQEHFFCYVESVAKTMIPMISKSPHEDVRSFCMVVVPELVRSTAKATIPDRTSLVSLAEYGIGYLVDALEKESIMELVMTGLQALKQILWYACTDWRKLNSESPSGSFMEEPPQLTPTTSIKLLNNIQMEALNRCTQIILRESVQRRAVMKAEAQISGGADEDDAADEQILLSENMELQYILAELLGTIFRSHGSDYFPIFMKDYGDIIHDLCQSYCIKEDRQFSLYIICDIIEFGLSPSTVDSFFATIMPLVIDTTSTCSDAGPRQAASYALGVAASKYSMNFAPYAHSALTALHSSVAMGEDGELRGYCTDNSVLAVGIILESMENIVSTIDYNTIWNHWLGYFPLKHDIDEGHKAIRQLLRLLESENKLFFSPSRVVQSIVVFSQVYQSELSTRELNNGIAQMVQNLFNDSRFSDSISQLVSRFEGPLLDTFENILAHSSSSGIVRTSSSPGPSAPISDVLFRSN